MTKEEKVLHWLEISDYDIDTAKVMYETKRYTYVAFMCQQAVEKAVKGLHIYVFDEEAQKTHNINVIFNRILESDYNFETNKNNIELKYLDNYQKLFKRLLMYYIESRYADYKEKINKLITDTEAEELLIESEECLKWIKSLMKLDK